jgi:predicted MFS family arabinose efflux permease
MAVGTKVNFAVNEMKIAGVYHHRQAASLPPLALPNRAGVMLPLFLVGFGTFLNLYAPQPVLPEFRQIFHANEFQVSLTISASILAVALAATPVGLLADAVGRKRVIVAAMLGLSIPTFMAATASNLNHLIGWRFLQGFFIPGIIAVTMAYISEESPTNAVGSTMATYVSGTVAGGFVGRFSVGLITPEWGWRMAFALLGVATAILGLVAWWLLPRATRFVRHHNARASLQSLLKHVRNPQLLATYAVGFNVLFCLVGAFTYVNFYLADPPFHLGTRALSAIFLIYLVGALLTPLTGRVLDKVGCRRVVVAAALAGAVGALLTLIHWVPLVIVGLTLGACGAFACQSAASSHVGKAAGQARSSAAGLYVTFYYLGGCAGSVLPGIIWRHAGWVGCVGLLIGVQTATAWVAWRLWNESTSTPLPSSAAELFKMLNVEC